MPTAQINIGLLNPKSPTNVGAVMRAAGCFQAQGIYYTGKRYDRAASHQTDTKNVMSHIPLNGVTDLLESKPSNSKIVCIELVEGAIPLPEYIHPENAFYIFGPEDGTIDQSVIDGADHVVYIPTKGCLNLAATVNVVLYDRTAKSSNTIMNNELIRRSRDVNNRTRIKNN